MRQKNMRSLTELLQGFLPNTSPTLIAQVVNLLRYRYEYPVRPYHNWRHISNCLIELDEYKKSLKRETVLFDDKELDFVEIALNYHDCIYNPADTQNELLSANRAFIDMKGLGFIDPYAAKVRDLILLTKHTENCNYLIGQVMMDIDISIFGSHPNIFKEYNIAIRNEYSFIPDSIYNVERIKVLSFFLAKPTIYQTSYFYNLYEEQARKNITNCIELLLLDVSPENIEKLQKDLN
jgi:predicted metal-dependent HD superfamily phosphohydrolase